MRARNPPPLLLLRARLGAQRVPLEVQVSTMSMNHFEWLLQFREVRSPLAVGAIAIGAIAATRRRSRSASAAGRGRPRGSLAPRVGLTVPALGCHAQSLRIQEQQLGMGGKEMEDMRLMIADTNKVCFATDRQGHTVATVPQHSGVLCSSALCRSGAPSAVSTLTPDNSVATCILASPRLASPRLASPRLSTFRPCVYVAVPAHDHLRRVLPAPGL